MAWMRADSIVVRWTPPRLCDARRRGRAGKPRPPVHPTSPDGPRGRMAAGQDRGWRDLHDRADRHVRAAARTRLTFSSPLLSFPTLTTSSPYPTHGRTHAL